MPNSSVVWKPLVDFVLPPRCPICGTTVDDDHQICLSCWRELEFLHEPWCASCGKPFEYERQQGMICGDCLIRRPDHDGVRAVVRYDDNSALVPMRLKYGLRLGMADLIARHLVPFARDMPADSIIVPVPLHRRRLWSRGFNQAVLIGRALARETDMPIDLDVIRRNRATPPLRSMSPEKRRKIVRGAFDRGNSAQIVNKRPVILVDDVYTSGATANACARLLKTAGASMVRIFCWARVLKDVESD